MFFYFWTDVTASAEGQAVRQVDCVNCRMRYQYPISKGVDRYAHVPFMLGVGRAKRKAKKQAEAALAHHLYEYPHPVPCPKCYYIQPDMVPALAEKTHSMTRVIAKIFLWLCLPLFGLYMGISISILQTIGLKWGSVGVAFVISILLAVVVPWRIYRSAKDGYKNFDPNTTIPVDRRMEMAEEWSAQPVGHTP